MSPPARWTCFRVVLAATSPIHIGWHDLGMVKRTRYYIPARNLWGLLVSGLARRLPSGGTDESIYLETEKRLRTRLRFTCFFPMDGRHPAGDAWQPKYTPHGFFMGEKQGSDFEHEFVFSQTSAALDASNLTAQEGALHESEYLSHISRTRIPLGFLGYLFIRSDLDDGAVSAALETCWVGADRRYGWGQLRCCHFGAYENEALFGTCRVVDWDQDGGPILEFLDSGRYVPAHARVIGTEHDFGGELEVVGGRDWVRTGEHEAAGSGQGIARVELCWAPGSRRVKDAGAIRFGIEERGLWVVRANTGATLSTKT